MQKLNFYDVNFVTQFKTNIKDFSNLYYSKYNTTHNKDWKKCLKYLTIFEINIKNLKFCLVFLIKFQILNPIFNSLTFFFA